MSPLDQITQRYRQMIQRVTTPQTTSNTGGNLRVTQPRQPSFTGTVQTPTRQSNLTVQNQARQQSLQVRPTQGLGQLGGTIANPQQAWNPQQQSAGSPQPHGARQGTTPAAPPPPIRNAHTILQRTVDPHTGEVTTISSVSWMTDDEWRQAQERMRIQNEIVSELEELRKFYSTEGEWGQAVEDRLRQKSHDMQIDFIVESGQLNNEFKSIAQQFNNFGINIHDESTWGLDESFFQQFSSLEDAESALDQLEALSSRLETMANYTREGGLFEEKYRLREEALINVSQKMLYSDRSSQYWRDQRGAWENFSRDVGSMALHGAVWTFDNVIYRPIQTVGNLAMPDRPIHSPRLTDRTEGVRYRDSGATEDFLGHGSRYKMRPEEDNFVDNIVSAWRYSGGQTPVVDPRQAMEDPSHQDHSRYVNATPTELVWNQLNMIFQDPSMLIPGAAVRKGARYAGSTRPAQFMGEQFSNFRTGVGNTRLGEFGRWLNDVPNTYQNRLNNAVKETISTLRRELNLSQDIFQAQRAALTRLTDNWQSNRVAIQQSVAREVARRMAQETQGMVSNQIRLIQAILRGNQNAINRLSGSLSPDQIAASQRVADVWRRRLDDMQQAERAMGINTPYRLDYVPDPRSQSIVRRARSETSAKTDPWFTQEKGKSVMVGNKRFIRSMVKREFDSMLYRGEMPTLQAIKQQISKMGYQIDDMGQIVQMLAVRPQVYVSRSAWEKFVWMVQYPMQKWRQSVTIFRPAFYINNEISNQILGLVEGGGRFIVSQRQMQALRDQMKRLGITADDISGSYMQDLGLLSSRATVTQELRASTRIGRMQNKLSRLTNAVRPSTLASGQENRVRAALYEVRYIEAYQDYMRIAERMARTAKLTDRTIDPRMIHVWADHKARIAGRKAVSNTFFDYTTKRWESIPRSIIPFWHWQKNIARFTLTLPVRNPQAASIYEKYKEQLYDIPRELLPDKTMTGVDPTTGEEFEYNPYEEMEGKLYLPWTNSYYNAPMDPFSFRTHTGWGLNPFMSSWLQKQTRQDHFGNWRPISEGWIRALGSQLPQWQIADDMWESYLQELAPSRAENRWLADGSGFPKMSQGYDPTQPNYRADLDNRVSFWVRSRSFWGMPNAQEFDHRRFDENWRYMAFNAIWFSTDWDKYEWDARVTMQEALAREHGFDLYDDIFNDRWSRYDTPWTERQKELKAEARAFNNDFWTEYHRQPMGTRTHWVQQKRLEWAESQKFMENPYYDVLRHWMVDAERPNPVDKMRQIEFWQAYWASSKEVRRQMIRDNPEFQRFNNSSEGRFFSGLSGEALEHARRLGLAAYRATPKGMFWETFFTLLARKPREASEFYRENWQPHFGGKAPREPREVSFWIEYYAEHDYRKRRQMLEDHPDYDPLPPITDWDSYREARRKEREKTIARARDELDGFKEVMDEMEWMDRHRSRDFIRPEDYRRITYKIR